MVGVRAEVGPAAEPRWQISESQTCHKSSKVGTKRSRPHQSQLKFSHKRNTSNEAETHHTHLFVPLEYEPATATTVFDEICIAVRECPAPGAIGGREGESL